MADSPGEKPLHLIIEEFAEYQVLEPHFFQDLIFRSQVYERCHIHIHHYPCFRCHGPCKKHKRVWWMDHLVVALTSSSGQLQHFACRTFGLGSSCWVLRKFWKTGETLLLRSWIININHISQWLIILTISRMTKIHHWWY